MRVLLFVLTSVFSTWAVAVQPVAGFIERKGQDIYLQANDDCPSYRIETKSTDAQVALEKLSPGDHITATGIYDKDTCQASIESVDYVGLKRMLGTWISRQGVISVHDFKTLSFYPGSNTDLKASRNSDDFQTVKPVDYKYSVTPSDGKEWVLFLSDLESTTFATIQFSKEIAIMKIYDTDNGNVTKTLILTRRGNLK